MLQRWRSISVAIVLGVKGNGKIGCTLNTRDPVTAVGERLSRTVSCAAAGGSGRWPGRVSAGMALSLTRRWRLQATRATGLRLPLCQQGLLQVAPHGVVGRRHAGCHRQATP
ncbi:hypothetical protein, partial [Stenomitos frigidus]|uniref:hypothetical protein n=1 Tax=Stenomitos frigidus TaxID=1886765 RepID=UPI0030DB4FDC